MAGMNIHKMSAGDWERVSHIYLEGIATGNATFETEAPSWEEWDARHLSFARLVAESTDPAEVIGWAALSPVSVRSVYSGVAEVSVYVAAAARGRGVGRMLLVALIQEAETNGIWTLQSSVFAENSATLSLHRSCGFREVGTREKIACLNGQWRDTVLFERRRKRVGS